MLSVIQFITKEIVMNLRIFSIFLMILSLKEATLICELIRASKSSMVHFVNLKNIRKINFGEFSSDYNVSYHFFEIRKIKTNARRKIETTILPISNMSEFEEFYEMIKPEDFRYDGHFIILSEEKSLDVEKIFFKMWKLWIFNVNILLIDASIIPMFTFYPFTNTSCNSTKAIKINEFDMKSTTWKTKIFFPFKFKNLYGCPIRVGSFKKAPFFIVKSNGNDSIHFSGIDVDFIKIFGSVLRFTPKFHEKDAVVGRIFKNGTSTGLLGYAYRNQVDLVTGSLSLQLSRVEFLTASKTIYSDKLILVIPPPFLIGSLTKIFMPFSITLWICISLTILIACVIIIVLKFLPRIFHNYIIGREVRGRILNLWAHLFGMNQIQLPSSTFPRFLLAKFLIFALVIRSLYQGAIYKLLKEDISTIEYNRIEDLFEHQFTFYIYESLASRLTGTKFMENHKVVSQSDLSLYELKTLDPNFKGSVFAYKIVILFSNIENRNHYKLRICKEALLLNQFVFYFSKNFYIVNDFDRVMGYIRSAGLVEHIISNYIDINMVNENNQKNKPSSLDFSHLRGIFELLLYGQITATLCFTVEIIYGKISARKCVKIFPKN